MKAKKALLTSVDAIMDAKFEKVGSPKRKQFREEARAYCSENAFSGIPLIMQKKVKKVDSFLNIGYSGVMKTALLLGLTELESKVAGKKFNI
jgi:hypothetical protein